MKITQLTEKQVFVFGANCGGFHGAGSAGFAFHGDSGNSWRTNPQFQRANKALQAKERRQNYNPEDLKGNWAVLGKTGFMEGKTGKSYGIITTERPGEQGRVNDAFLLKEMKDLIHCATENPDLEFLCVNFGVNRANGGFSWWTPDELKKLWAKAIEETGPLPSNLKQPDWATKSKSEPSGFKPAQPVKNGRGPSGPFLDLN